MVAATLNPVVSMMLAVPDTQVAIAWYARALGATLLWDLGSVAGLEIAGRIRTDVGVICGHYL